MDGQRRRSRHHAAPVRLVAINLNRPHFRTARWWLLAEGVALMALGVAGLLIRPPYPDTVASAADWESWH